MIDESWWADKELLLTIRQHGFQLQVYRSDRVFRLMYYVRGHDPSQFQAAYSLAAALRETKFWLRWWGKCIKHRLDIGLEVGPQNYLQIGKFRV